MTLTRPTASATMSKPAGRVRLDWDDPHWKGAGRSGNFTVAVVVQRAESGRWAWLMQVPTRWICAGEGEVATRAAARRAVERAWARWLAHAALEPIAADLRDGDLS